jgi:hypothetical protein
MQRNKLPLAAATIVLAVTTMACSASSYQVQPAAIVPGGLDNCLCQHAFDCPCDLRKPRWGCPDLLDPWLPRNPGWCLARAADPSVHARIKPFPDCVCVREEGCPCERS